MKHYTNAQAAEYLGVSPSYLTKRRLAGKIEYIQEGPGTKVLYTEKALQEYLARNTRKVKAPFQLTGPTLRKRRAV